ncbi:calcineurin-like phosphoesterase C-terminal domain-containing protein [Daejeonella oryzae]|uniref:calcineurin-like phosphoesterase C-terminal domain-containing protein n=1 Tax=Daejeonella oryzae TaxID=1122943 RepID=UPI000479D55C|nr:calcineurin-like phosphoesterase family protein [Daejeonella oryzae]
MKRRAFIQNMFLLSGGFMLSANETFAFVRTSGKKIKGTVRSFGKRLSNVVVSDGFSVVKTNSRGKYEMPFHELARFVFISVPAGYAFPQQNGLAKHYHTLTDEKKQICNFELTPLKADDSKHNFIIWADPQVKNERDVQLMLSQSVPDVRRLIEESGSEALFHGIGVGDLVWDEHSLFKRYNEAVAGMGIPFFQVLGNHDMDYNKGGDESSDQTFSLNYGPTYYSFNRGKVHYVVLDDVRYLGKDRNYDGYISRQQLNWLKQDLSMVPKDNLLIISVHIPVHNSVDNNTDLYALLEPFKKVHIMSGHTHFNKNVIQNGVYEHNHGTVCGAWWTGPVCGDGTPGGYGVYEVEGTDLKWYYKATGLDKNYQISLDIEELSHQKRLLVNVWNWDPEWKVEWWADDKPMGVLENVMGFDPMAVKLYKGDKLPLKRSFAEPSRTDHLFMAHFSPEIKMVKVVATDRFGTKYEQKINA